jgi:CDP-glucose 4,6-dehydratase
MFEEPISILRNSPGPILITGHTGFKGTWLTLLLGELGIQTVGYSLPAEDNSMYQRLNRNGAIVEQFGDLKDKKKLEDFFASTKPSFVMHMAAQPLVLESYKEPLKTFETNVMGTVNVIEAAFKSQKVTAIGIVTTDKVYRNNDTHKKFIESDTLEGKDPYSASKVATESVVQAWRKIQEVSGGPQIIALRAGNVIGGGDFANNRIIPDLIRGMISQEIVEIRNMNNTRPWQHALDPLFGYLLALVKECENGNSTAYNFGPDDDSYSVSKLLEIVSSNFPNRIKTRVSKDSNSKLESQFLDLDSNFARKKLGWSPAWNQEKAIISTFKWWIDILENRADPLVRTKIDIVELIKHHKMTTST